MGERQKSRIRTVHFHPQIHPEDFSGFLVLDSRWFTAGGFLTFAWKW